MAPPTALSPENPGDLAICWPGQNVPAWFLDTDYNRLCFHVNQALITEYLAVKNLAHNQKQESILSLSV
ncbi:hypothetical protein [Phormidium sp. CCY1219]|uniref:hypothetical protein n=1 Tax=Phormidium sp. CCY1219 TaxID=2886104 RepID=UPI002D1F1D97|nr:hypothetical protein [Phormidium sp. CCY1219]MEB3830326.1 hypothetical protein [Phormidium sp. CCY1219]